MSNYDVIKKLMGVLTPIGSSYEDDKRFKNLVDTCELIDELIRDIKWVSEYSDSKEHSVKRAADYATKFLNDLKS